MSGRQNHFVEDVTQLLHNTFSDALLDRHFAVLNLAICYGSHLENIHMVHVVIICHMYKFQKAFYSEIIH